MPLRLCVLTSGIFAHPHDVHALFEPVMSFISQHSAVAALPSADTLLIRHPSAWFEW